MIYDRDNNTLNENEIMQSLHKIYIFYIFKEILEENH